MMSLETAATLAVADVMMPLAIGAFLTFVIFLFLGLGALPFTAALDRTMGKEKALLLYSGILLVLTFLMFGKDGPKAGTPRPGKVKNMKVEPLDLTGDPFARPSYALVSSSSDAPTRNMFQRWSDTSPLPPPSLDMPPVLALDVALPPTSPGPAPGHRWVLRGAKPTIDPESTAGIAEVPDAAFQDYQVQPGDVFDALNAAGATTYIFVSAINDGNGWVKFGQSGYEDLARRLTTEEGQTLEMQFGVVGGEKATLKRLDSNADGKITAGEISIAQNAARLTISATRALNESETVTLRRTVDNLYAEALRRNGIRRNFREGPKDVGALRRAARDMAKVGATGKEGGEGWRRAASLLDTALGEAKRVGNNDTRTEVLLELLAAYRALHDEQSVLKVLAEYVRTNPRRADGWTWLGDLALERMGQDTLALSYYDEALSHNAGHAGALIGKGRALALAGDHSRARDSFSRATGAAGAKYFRALGMLRAGELDRAKAEVDALLVRDANNPDAILLRGCVLYALGKDLASARAAFERVATMPEASAQRAKACYNLGLTCIRMGQRQAALSAFEKTERALERGASAGDTPDEAVVPELGLAFLAWSEDDHAKATEYLDKARERAPRCSYVEMFAGMHAATEERFAKADLALNRALVLAPAYAELDGWLGFTYLGLARAAVESGAEAKEQGQNFDRAVAFMERAADREAKVIQGAYAMRVREAMVRAGAENLPRRTRYNNALKAANKVLKQDKTREQPAALAVRGYCNFQLADYDQCIRDLQQVKDVVPVDAGEGNPWLVYRTYADGRLTDVKRWRSLEKKTVAFEGVTLPKDWSSTEGNGVRVTLEDGKLHVKGTATKDGSINKPTFDIVTSSLYDKASFEEISITFEVPGEVNGRFKNNNISGIQVLQVRGGGSGRARKASGIGVFSDKGRLAFRVGNGKLEKFKDGEVHRLIQGGQEVNWPSNGPVRVRIVREDADTGEMAIYLNGKRVFGDRISGFKRTRGKLALWIGGYGNQAEPYDIWISDIEVIRRQKQ